MPMMISSSQKDEINIVAIGIPEVRVPIKKLPLVADECDAVLVGGVAISGLALAGTGLYGWIAHPFPFNNYECDAKYWGPLFEQSRETNVPCKIETDFRSCISKLVEKFCAADKVIYDNLLPEKKVAAWTPFMIAAAATVGFNGGWLLGKWIARAMRPKPVGSNEMLLEEVV